MMAPLRKRGPQLVDLLDRRASTRNDTEGLDRNKGPACGVISRIAVGPLGAPTRSDHTAGPRGVEVPTPIRKRYDEALQERGSGVR